MEIATRSYWTAGTALTAAAVTLSPLIAGPAALQGPTLPTLPALPSVSAPQVRLAAVVSPEDIEALVGRLNSALASVSSTVTSVVALPGNSLTAALESAVSVNNSLWAGLIDATDNRALTDLLTALRATSSGGLSRLANTVGSSGDALVLTTGEVTELLASALTGSLSTALHAVAAIVNNPLALSSYTGLLNVPLDVVGGVLHNGLSIVDSVGKGALSVTSSLVTGVTSQIDNILNGVNGVIDSAKGAIPGVALIDGVLTAVQGIVSAPVTAALAGVDGLTGTLSDAAARALGNLTHGAGQLVDTWLGDGVNGGALQHAINAIGSAPLSVASYTQALGVVVSAGINTGRAVVSTATGLLSVPFTAGADLTSTATAMITRFTDGVATAAVGILRAAGLPSFVSALPRALAETVKLTVRAVGSAVAAGFNSVAALLDVGSVMSASVTSVPREASSRLLVATSSADSPAADQLAVTTAQSAARTTTDGDGAGQAQQASVEPPTAAEAVAAETAAEEAATGDQTTGDAAELTDPDAEQLVDAVQAEAVSTEPEETDDPESTVNADDSQEAATPEAVSDAPTDKGTDKPGEQDSPATSESDTDTAAVSGSGTRTAPSAGSPRRGLAGAPAEADSDTEKRGAKPYGRHASGQTAGPSSSDSVGRHRSDSTGSGTAKAPSSQTRGSSAGSEGSERSAA